MIQGEDNLIFREKQVNLDKKNFNAFRKIEIRWLYKRTLDNPSELTVTTDREDKVRGMSQNVSPVASSGRVVSVEGSLFTTGTKMVVVTSDGNHTSQLTLL